jgi:hypothetical protein
MCDGKIKGPELIDSVHDPRVLRIMNYTGSIEVTTQEEVVSPTLR